MPRVGVTNRDSTDSPVRAVVDEARESAAAFELLGNEIRLAILLAIWEAYEPHGRRAVPLSFTELNDRVGVRDSGQFNYHLEKLIGTFVTDTGEGYALKTAGHSIVEAVIAGTGIENASLDVTETELNCPLCESPTAIGYQNETLYQVCTECDGHAEKMGFIPEAAEGYGGVLYVAKFEPAGLSNRTAKEMFEACVIKATLRNAMQLMGVCSRCSGLVVSSIEVCEEHIGTGDEICPHCGTRWGAGPIFACTVCKRHDSLPPTFPANFHPNVIDFYADNGITIGDLTNPGSIVRIQSLLQNQEADLVSTDPPEIRVTIRHDGDTISMSYDENVNIIATNHY